jgi:hypothetical protein
MRRSGCPSSRQSYRGQARCGFGMLFSPFRLCASPLKGENRRSVRTSRVLRSVPKYRDHWHLGHASKHFAKHFGAMSPKCHFEVSEPPTRFSLFPRVLIFTAACRNRRESARAALNQARACGWPIAVTLSAIGNYVSPRLAADRSKACTEFEPTTERQRSESNHSQSDYERPPTNNKSPAPSPRTCHVIASKVADLHNSPAADACACPRVVSTACPQTSVLQSPPASETRHPCGSDAQCRAVVVTAVVDCIFSVSR